MQALQPSAQAINEPSVTDAAWNYDVWVTCRASSLSKWNWRINLALCSFTRVYVVCFQVCVLYVLTKMLLLKFGINKNMHLLKYSIAHRIVMTNCSPIHILSPGSMDVSQSMRRRNRAPQFNGGCRYNTDSTWHILHEEGWRPAPKSFHTVFAFPSLPPNSPYPNPPNDD